MQTRKYRNYDPEIKGLVIKSGSLSLAKRYDIPRNRPAIGLKSQSLQKEIVQ